MMPGVYWCIPSAKLSPTRAYKGDFSGAYTPSYTHGNPPFFRKVTSLKTSKVVLNHEN